ncbi:MAG: hypothetical protein C0473_00880 [Cyanobacteria bacterium DS3.002]|nr:hypothetical protein [Cyanobacteria bacterium DS3.002]MBA4049501.1 hypothetical protein [Cyanobacteria bacterium DS2.008]MBA4074218.1 hypothetical protein [Cyanobacteria bacterium PR.023]
MGLMIHSLGELPITAERGYYVYILDFGWEEPLGAAVRSNFDKMAEAASRSNAVVMKGTVGVHFADEVLSWHHINGQPGKDILPALLITTMHPRKFHELHLSDAQQVSHDKMLLIPLQDSCKSATDVSVLLENLFSDIRDKKQLTNFEIAKELCAGKDNAIVDALILKPNFNGLGLDFNVIIDRLKRKKRNK